MKIQFEVAPSQVDKILELANKCKMEVETYQNEFLEQTHFISKASNLEIHGKSAEYIIIHNDYKDGFVCGQTMVMTNLIETFDFYKNLYLPRY